MVGEFKRIRLNVKPPVLEKIFDESGVMLHRDIKPKVLVIATECIEAMGACGDDFLHPVGLNCLYVFLRRHLIEVFISQLARRFATAFLLLAENANLYAGS